MRVQESGAILAVSLLDEELDRRPCRRMDCESRVPDDFLREFECQCDGISFRQGESVFIFNLPWEERARLSGVRTGCNNVEILSRGAFPGDGVRGGQPRRANRFLFQEWNHSGAECADFLWRRGFVEIVRVRGAYGGPVRVAGEDHGGHPCAGGFELRAVPAVRVGACVEFFLK